MLAKNLVIFIAIGVIAGLVFGMYLVDVKNQSRYVLSDGPLLSIVTEKSDFKRGEEIAISLVNSGTVPITFPDDSYGLRITGLSGILMFSPVPFGTTVTLDPGNRVGFSWNQLKNDGDAVLEGLYKISAKGVDDEGNNVEKSATVTIWK